jgi:dihydrofolate reductase
MICSKATGPTSRRAAATPGALRLAGILDEKTKYVVTSRALAPVWNARSATPTQGAIATLRDEVGGDILLVASLTLARALLRWGLVSEYHIAISPMVAGHGPHFLEGFKDDVLPKLLDVTRLRSGVLFLRYGFGGQRGAA